MGRTSLQELHRNTGKFWRTISPLFHKGEEDLPQQLDKILQEFGVAKDDPILDAACGTGFPAIELSEMDYTNIRCSDASATTVAEFKKISSLPIHQLRWREVNELFHNLKAILVPGSSIAYVSSWDKPEEVTDREAAIGELKESFTSFYKALTTDGFVIIGVSKTSNITQPKEFVLGEIEFKGRKLTLCWRITPLLDKGLRQWETIITDSETRETDTITRYGVRITVNEVIELLKQSGFKNIELRDISPQHYDYQIIGQK